MVSTLGIFAFLIALGALAYVAVVAMKIDDKCAEQVEARLQGFRAEIKKRSENIQAAANQLRTYQSNVGDTLETCLEEIRSLKRRVEELEQRVQQAGVNPGTRAPNRGGRSAA